MIVPIGEENIDLSGVCSMTFERRNEVDWVEVGDCSAIPNYVPEPFPSQSGDIIEVTMPYSSLGIKYVCQYELSPSLYRINITYFRSEGSKELTSAEFRITQ